MFTSKLKLPSKEEALRGRPERMPVAPQHRVLAAPLDDEFKGFSRAMFGMGSFWGAERRFWTLPGVVSTAVGYAGGFTENPIYKEVRSGATGHTEVVRVIFDVAKISYETLLKVFWEGHDPTQGMRQGTDVGTLYRSALFTFSEEQRRAAEASRAAYQAQLSAAGYETLTTELDDAPTFFFAEDYHQQYLARHAHGYAGAGGTGIVYPGAPAA